MPSPPTANVDAWYQRHLPPLDGVRGLAILMVIGSHAFVSNAAASGRVIRGVGQTLNYGFLGVDLFFGLSGFLITGILVDSVNQPGYFGRFYARRVLRIFPLYYGVLVTLFLLTPALHLHWQGMVWLFMGYFQNLRPGVIGNFSPGTGLALNHFWSLAVEEQFYLLWPAAVYLIQDRKRLLVTTLGISAFSLVLRCGLIVMGAGPEAIHVSTMTRADSLLLGGALALLWRSPFWGYVERAAPYGFGVAAGLVAVSAWVLPSEFEGLPATMAVRLWVDGGRYSVVAVGAACLIACSLRSGSLCLRLFSGAALRFFGKYSYGIYVFHAVALPLILRDLRPAIFNATHSKVLAVAGAGVAALAFAVGVAYLSFHLYEKPFLRLKRLFDDPSKPRPWQTEVSVASSMSDDLVDLAYRKREVSLR